MNSALIPTANVLGLTAEGWTEILHQAFQEMSEAMLGGRKWEAVELGRTVATHLPGSYVPIFTAEKTMHVGLVAPPAAMQELAHAFLGADPSEGDLPQSEVADAIGEMVNIIAGGAKRAMANVQGVRLGLPLFVKSAQSSPGALTHALTLKCAECSLQLVVLSTSQADAP